MKETWSYHSVVGMLLYLSNNTRPDITFAIRQVARFVHNPKQSHATAVKMIVRYLVRTKDQGIIITPTGSLDIDGYADADFVGLFGSEPDVEPTSTKSRSGITNRIGGCHLLSKSHLQPTVTLSTAESEYIALSQCMRMILPICELLLEIIRNVDIPSRFATFQATIRTTVHEDNNSALFLAKSQRVTSRTRHYSVRYHFFWEHVKSGEVHCVAIASVDQRADYLAKGLLRNVFECCRRLNQDW